MTSRATVNATAIMTLGLTAYLLGHAGAFAGATAQDRVVNFFQLLGQNPVLSASTLFLLVAAAGIYSRCRTFAVTLTAFVLVAAAGAAMQSDVATAAVTTLFAMFSMLYIPAIFEDHDRVEADFRRWRMQAVLATQS